MSIKPLLPSLLNKKRYLVYEIMSKKPILHNEISNEIKKVMLAFLGELGVAHARAKEITSAYNPNKQRGIIRADHTAVTQVRAALTTIKTIQHQDVLTRTIGVSGIINKAQKKYIAG